MKIKAILLFSPGWGFVMKHMTYVVVLPGAQHEKCNLVFLYFQPFD